MLDLFAHVVLAAVFLVVFVGRVRARFTDADLGGPVRFGFFSVGCGP